MSKGFSNLFDGTQGARKGAEAIKAFLQKQLTLNLTEILSKKYNAIHSINKNISKISEKYKLHKNGYFGEPGKNSGVRVIKSKDQYKDSFNFFSILSKGAKITNLGEGKVKAEFNKNQYLVYRVVTKTKNSPAVDITINGMSKLKTQKIHFEKE